MTVAAPVIAVLQSEESAGKASLLLKEAMRELLAPLVARIGWSEQPSQPVVSSHTASTPWPSHEDSHIETRAMASIRPVALLNAVLYGDESTILVALRTFREAANTNSSIGAGARAAYFAAARHGTPEDKVALGLMLYPSCDANMLFGFSAGADDKISCELGLKSIRDCLGHDPALVIGATEDVIQYAPACRTLVWSPFAAAAGDLWAKEGSGATSSITKAFATLSNSAELAAVTSLLETQNLSVVDRDTKVAALTQIMINIDLANTNSESE